MKAIRTRYLGATNTRGSRIKADDGDGNTVTISYPHEFSGADVHAQAAIALCQKMGWRGMITAGGLDNGYVFTFSGSDTYPV